MKKEHRILAINPGKRYLGIAVFLGTELRDWTLKVVKERRIVEVLSEFVDRYQISAIALKKYHPSRTSNDLQKVIGSIKEFAKNHGGCIYEYSIDDIKDEFLPQKPRNKKCLLDEILIRYPFLYKSVEQEKRNKSRYLMRMFEAIGVGANCLTEIDIKERKVEIHKKMKNE